MSADKLEEVERLTLENLTLKIDALTKERQFLLLGLRAKYGGESVSGFAVDGTIQRVTELKAVE